MVMIMEKNNKTSEKSKNNEQTSNVVNKTTVKVSAMWYFIAYYLELMEFVSAADDEEFSRRFHGLLDYVYGKIGLPTDAGDIVGEYVVYELEP